MLAISSLAEVPDSLSLFFHMASDKVNDEYRWATFYATVGQSGWFIRIPYMILLNNLAAKVFMHVQL